MNNPLAAFAMRALSNNPNVKNNPLAQELMQCLESGDSARGEEIANNLCQTYGTNREEALKQARGFFHI